MAHAMLETLKAYNSDLCHGRWSEKISTGW